MFLSIGFNAASVERLSDDDLELLRHVRRRPARRLPAGRVAAAVARLRAGARADGRRRGAPLPPLRARAAHARRRPGDADGRADGRARARRCCRWPRRSWTACTSASCRTSSSRTSSATWRPTSRTRRWTSGACAWPIAFADLAGYTRLTEEEGEEEAVDAVERFMEDVEVTLPDDARVIKTIGDEVMIVGSDGAALVRLGRRLPVPGAERRPLPRIGMHHGLRSSTATATTTAARSTSPRASPRARPAARCSSRARSSKPPAATSSSSASARCA